MYHCSPPGGDQAFFGGHIFISWYFESSTNDFIMTLRIQLNCKLHLITIIFVMHLMIREATVRYMTRFGIKMLNIYNYTLLIQYNGIPVSL